MTVRFGNDMVLYASMVFVLFTFLDRLGVLGRGPVDICKKKRQKMLHIMVSIALHPSHIQKMGVLAL